MGVSWHRNPIQKRSYTIPCQKMRKALRYWKSHYFFIKITFPGAKKTIKNQSRIIPKLKSRWEALLTSIFSRFYSIFRAQDSPRPPQDGPQGSPKTLQNTPKTRQNRPESAPEPPQRRLEGVLEASGKPSVAQNQPRAAPNSSRPRL